MNMAYSNQSVARLILKDEIEQFLFAEAELLDAREYEQWLSLLGRRHPLLDAHAPERKIR